MSMRLWILRPVEGLPENDDPWEPWYDKAVGFVVRAETEAAARRLANAQAGDENSHAAVWLDRAVSTCVELTPEGDEGVVLRDYMAA